MAETTRVKVCGLREPEHGELAAELAVWAIGLVFAAGSPRLVSAERARLVATAAGADVAKVGVFVDTDPETIAHIADRVGLTHVQVHGPADIRRIREVGGRPVLAGYGIASPADLAVASASEADLVLLDAKVAGEHGGTGRSFEWALLRDDRPTRPFVVAGGLRVGNVAQVVCDIAPWGVDVSSGVEGERGVKDSGLIRAFVQAVRAAGDNDGSGG